MVVWRASPLRNETPRVGAWDGASVDAAAGAGRGGEVDSCVSGAVAGAGSAGAGSAVLGGGASLTGGVAIALVEAAGVGLG
jgi:hypothetical protein